MLMTVPAWISVVEVDQRSRRAASRRRPPAHQRAGDRDDQDQRVRSASLDDAALAIAPCCARCRAAWRRARRQARPAPARRRQALRRPPSPWPARHGRRLSAGRQHRAGSAGGLDGGGIDQAAEESRVTFDEGGREDSGRHLGAAPCSGVSGSSRPISLRMRSMVLVHAEWRCRAEEQETAPRRRGRTIRRPQMTRALSSRGRRSAKNPSFFAPLRSGERSVDESGVISVGPGRLPSWRYETGHLLRQA